MKNYKKLLLGFSLTAGLAFLGLSISINSARAQEATDWGKFWGSCAQTVVVGFGINCNIEDSNAKFTYATYSSAAPFVAATYQASYVDSPNKAPEIITITNSQTKELIDPTNNAIQNSRFKYASLKGSSKVVDDDGKRINYLVYYPSSGNKDYSLLVRDKGQGALQVLALVNNKVIERGNGDFIYGWKINKATLASTATGAPINPGNPPPDTTPHSACEEGSDTSASELNWIFCPVLRGVDRMFETINGLIEGQLNFCAGATGTAGGNHCKAEDSLLTPGVKQAWSIFRTIATSILVIIMLVMVISQAINAGIFDAYTVRKLLPRLVVAAIAIQLSWYIFKFTIDLSNDAGHGTARLMYLPFGGAGKMNFDNLIGNVGDLAAATTGVGIFVAIAIGIAFSGLTIFGVGFLALSAIASIIVAFLVLFFRELLIILAMILVPVALVAFILPGTQKYWKLWQDNFTKLLLMFPLIMALIASGRIFAYIAGTTEGSAIIALMAVFVGYFGPYWFLPKTFNWGGQMFGALAGATWNGTKRYRNFTGKYALDRAKENRQYNSQQRAARLAFGESRFRRFDELLAGRHNFARNSSARSRQYEATRAKGREEAEKGAQEAVIGSRYEAATHQQKLDGLFAAAQGHEDVVTGLNGNNPAVRRWALDKLAEFGDWDAITNLRSRNLVDHQDWEAFVAKNIGTIHQKAPHLSPLKPDLTELSAEDLPNFHTYTMQELEEQATHGVVRNAATGMVEQSGDPAAQRRRAVELAHRALNTQHIAARLTNEQKSTLERIIKLGGNELMAADDPGLAKSARKNYGVQIGGGTLALADQDAFEDNVLHIKHQAATSTQARTIYNQVVDSAHQELSDRVKRAEQEALAQGLSPAQVAQARADAQAAATADRERLVNKGITPL